VAAAPRGGAAWLGAVGAEAGRGALGMVLPGTLCCNSGSGCVPGSGPCKTLVCGDSGGSHHSLHPVWDEAFPAQTTGRRVELTSVLSYVVMAWRLSTGIDLTSYHLP
jgi:hypothetical protein